MFNKKIIFKILGSLLYIEGFFMMICMIMSIAMHGDDSMAFLISMLLTILSGTAMRYYGMNAENSLSRRDAYLVVTISWILFSLYGTLPFLISGYLNSFTNAFFENMSGFTTTGATIIDNVEALPSGLLFWRSLTQWIGGLGIVFFTIALLPSLVGGSTRVFAAEATGPIRTKLHPRLSTSAKWIWSVYFILTVGCMGSYMFFGMNWFEGLNFAMTTTATGGFSIYNASTEHFNSPALDYVTTLFCFLSGVNFPLLYFSLAKFKIHELFRNSEFRLYFFLVTGFTLFITFELVYYNDYSFRHAFRSAIFQVVSFITTTGLFNDDAAKWPHVTWVVLSICMFIGACSGSTSGGMKCIRGVMLIKVVKNEFIQLLHPNASLPLHVDGNNVPPSKRVTLLAFLTMYLVLCLLCAFVMIAAGIDNTNAITITLSSIGNVGPTLGTEIGPTMSWNDLPIFAKWISSFLMLVGRLEIFSVLVILTPQFWTRS